MRTSFKRTLVAGATSGLMLASLTGSAGAWGSYDRDSDRQQGEAASYINPDTGTATANPDVDPNSSCFRPDQYDMQRFSDPGTANRTPSSASPPSPATATRERQAPRSSEPRSSSSTPDHGQNRRESR
jgi:hypothetical protein